MGSYLRLIDSDICEYGLALDRYFMKATGIDALRPDAKLLFNLSVKGALSVKEAMFVSGLSYRGFYVTLGRLIDVGLVEVHKDGHDGRVRRISLCAGAGGSMLQPSSAGTCEAIA